MGQIFMGVSTEKNLKLERFEKEHGNDYHAGWIETSSLLDMNIEYRTHLFWKFDGAVFIDAGNIWTFRDYDDQPGGQFSFSRFWREIAVSYGMGIRFNFNYFLLRLDAGMKAINPAFEDTRRHYPRVYPKFSRDFTFHFAVGLPF